jgi:dTDP-glucose 4,6-dehydratase/UDP-glucuronate decarboxylase
MTAASRIIREDAELLLAESPQTMAAFDGASILVTGSAGFLGSYLMDVFATLNHVTKGPRTTLLAADNFRAAMPERLTHLTGESSVTFRTANIVERTDWGRRFDWIIHCASIASPTYYRQFPLETIDANVNGTWRMLELAEEHKSQGVLYFSSSEIYGDPDPKFIPTAEDYRGYVSCTGPRACYDESKRLGETLCISYHAQRGVKPKIVRPFNVYGPGQRLNDKRMVPDLMSAALAGGPLVLLSDGTPTRSFCYARDFIRGSLGVLAHGKPADPYNVGNIQEISMLDAARTMADVAGRDGKPLKIQYQRSADALYLTDNPNRRCPDLTKVRTELGYETKVDLHEGFARTYQHYVEEGQSRNG